jgi:hypothetical protein
MRLGDGSFRTSGGPFIRISFVVAVMLAGLWLWLLRSLSLLPLFSLLAGLSLLPGLTTRILRLLVFLFALLILHRIVASLLPLVLLLFLIRIHVGHAVFLLKM